STSTTVAGNENDKFERHGMKLGPATALVDFAKECKDKKLKAFSFSLQIHELKDSNKHFEHCVENILFRMKHYGSLVLDSWNLCVMNTFRPNFIRNYTLQMIQVDYAIEKTKVQRSILEGFAQNIKQLESSYETNKRKRKSVDDDFDYLYGIALEKRTEEYQTLRNGVKKVLSAIVGLIKDRACEDESPENKRVKIEGYRSKNKP
ncbi:4630_t:CDS:2, partial [Funneliformis caledonium]